MKWLRVAALLVMALVVVQLQVSAAKLPAIGDIYDPAWDDAQELMAGAAVLESGGDTDDLASLEVAPGDELRIYLDASMFADENGKQVSGADDGVTLSQLRTGRITIGTQSKQGAQLIEEIELDYDKGAAGRGTGLEEGSSYIKIAFCDYLVSVEEASFSVTVQLKVKGKGRSETQFTVAGVMENPRLDVLAGDDYLNLEEGVVAWAQDNVRECRIHLGDDLYITANLVKDQKYYGVAVVTGEAEILQRDPIVAIYDIYQLNLAPSGNACFFDLPQLYHVYGEDGTYLGTTAESLPYSDRYYLSEQELQDYQVTG